MAVKINQFLKDYIEKASQEHLNHVLHNRDVFIDPTNYTTVQYTNSTVNTYHFRFNDLIHRELMSLDNAARYLNFGVAAGHLELINRLVGYPLQITSVEWDHQYRCCEKIRSEFEVEVHYQCNSILNDNFEIFGMNDKHNYVILARFFPLYESKSASCLKSMLSRLAPYASKAIIIENLNNWPPLHKKWLTSFSSQIVHLQGTWNCFIIDLSIL